MMTKPTKIALPHCMQMPGPMQKTLRFGQFTLNPETATLSGATGPLPLRPKAFDLLCYLARHPGRVVSKTELIETVWRNIIVTDNALVQSIRDVRTALNDGGQEILKTVARRGYLFAAPVVEIEVPRAVLPPANRKTGALDLMPSDLTQEIHYARAPDGARIAWARVGQGPPLMRAANWLTHLEYDWENPLRVSGLINLAKNYTLIRYDPRGTGLSDWDVADLSLDAWVSDFETVVNAAGLKRFPVLAASQGCAVSISYAVRHPGRISHLVLLGGFALGGNKRSRQEKEKRTAMVTLMRMGWGADDPAFRQLFTSVVAPEATKEHADLFNELQRRTTSPECAARYFETVGDFDVRHLLGRVNVPTLVMHLRDDLLNPFEAGREMAAGIPGARFVALQGKNHFMLPGEPATIRFREEIELFLNR
jgi:DNA-binding winged helix-turn-helix (wHTH) protein/alpha-beta hydrolase superfamily lysophospholipase